VGGGVKVVGRWRFENPETVVGFSWVEGECDQGLI
jgi:hypothetical protein